MKRRFLNMFLKDMKIPQKLIIFTLIAASVPLLLASYMFYHKAEQIIYFEMSSSYKQILNQYVDNINYKLNLYNTLINNVTFNGMIQDTFSSSEKKEYSIEMDIINKISSEIDNLVVDKYQKETYNITVYPFDESLTYYQAHIGNLNSVKDTDWYKKIISGELPAYEGISQVSNLNISTLTLLRTIPNFKFNNYINTIGIIKLDVYSDRLFELNEEMINRKEQYIYILDNTNKIMYSNDSKNKANTFYRNFTAPENTDVHIESCESFGKKGTLVYKTIKPYDWTVLYFFDNSEIKKKLDDARNSILITDAVLCIILTLLTILFSRVFSKRVNMLTGKMKNVMDGDLEIRYKIDGKDEIAVLDKDFNSMIDKLKELINENYVQKLEKREAQLEALQFQINPHFLYNTLESINSIASVYGCLEVCNISQRLGEMFRYNINSGKSEFVALSEEIQHIRNYEYIQKIRFDDMFVMTYLVPEELEEYIVLKFILQPIVENAIYHGFRNHSKTGHIRISAVIIKTTLVIEVEDDGAGIEDEKLKNLNDYINDKNDKNSDEGRKSIGLKNVNSRIKLCYGDEYGITIKSTVDIGTKVTIKMPVRCSVRHKGDLVKADLDRLSVQQSFEEDLYV